MTPLLTDVQQKKIAINNPIYTSIGVFTEEMKRETASLRKTLRKELTEKLKTQQDKRDDLYADDDYDASLKVTSKSVKALVNKPWVGGKRRKMESKKKRRKKNKNKSKTKSRSRHSLSSR